MYKGVIYCATSPSNKKYYGLTLNFSKRKNCHRRYSEFKKCRFYTAIKKYGFDNFIWEIIETYKNEYKLYIQNILCEREKYWIEKDKTYYPEYGYNMTRGGIDGDAFTNKSENDKERIRLIKSNRFSGKNNPMFGKKFYDIWVEKYGKEIADEKLKIWCKNSSEIRKGISHPCSEETKLKISKTLMGEKHFRFIKLNNEQISEIIDLYTQKNYSITQIQKINHQNYYKIKKVLLENGVNFRNLYKKN